MLVHVFIILDGSFSQHGFGPKTRIFQYPHGPCISFQHAGENAINLKVVEDVTHHSRYGFRQDAPAPKFLPQPVTNLGIIAVDIILYGEAYIANRLLIDLNGQVVGLLIRPVGTYPGLGITRGVRKRKKIANVIPDVTIAGVFG